MPIIGTIASSIRAATAGTFESIATALPNGSVYTVSFTGIPSTYKHLQLRMYFREGGSNTGQSEWYLKFNGDNSGGNYWKMRWYGTDNTLTAQGGAVGSEGIWGTPSVRGGATDRFGCAIVDIHDYAGDKFKSARIQGMGWNTSTVISLGNASGPWQSTAAITSIQIEGNTTAMQFGSIFALYGIKGSA